MFITVFRKARHWPYPEPHASSPHLSTLFT